MNDLNTILRIEASPRKTNSVTRELTSKVIDHLGSQTAILVTDRNVSDGLPVLDADWINANFTPIETRTDSQKAKLALSDALVEEVRRADTLVIGMPIYNFGIPATLKAWVDHVARAGVTFRYTENGPVGLLEGKRVIVVIASGGTSVGSDIDFASPYIRHALKFIGITDVTIIAADALAQNAIEKIADATTEIASLEAA